MKKKIQYKIKGMHKDLSISAINNEYSYENHNVRIDKANSENLLSLINERGPLKLKIVDENNEIINFNNITIEEELFTSLDIIGSAYINETIVIFGQLLGESMHPALGRRICDIIFTLKEIKHVTPITFKYVPLVYSLGYLGQSSELNFSNYYPIKCTTYEESKYINKVYWVDGINSLRSININDEETSLKKRLHNINSIPKLQLKEDVSIVKNYGAEALFPSGMIQYAFTYYNKFGQESNIFYISELIPLSYSDRAGSPEEIINCNLSISIFNLDYNFEYIRPYSVIRTSLNGTPEVKKLQDIKIPTNKTNEVEYKDSVLLHLPFANVEVVDIHNNNYTIEDRGGYSSYTQDDFMYPIKYIKTITSETTYYYVLYNKDFTLNLNSDDGTVDTLVSKHIQISTNYNYLVDSIRFTDNNTGSTIASDYLILKGGQEIIAGCINQKDNILFLGDIKINKPVNINIKDYFSVSFKFKKMSQMDLTDNYNYPYNGNNILCGNTFKYGEYYKIGIQLQDDKGVWSDPFHVDTLLNTLNPLSQISGNIVTYYASTIKCVKKQELPENFLKYRVVYVIPSITDKKILAQGIVQSTMFNSRDRDNMLVHSIPSYIPRLQRGNNIDDRINKNIHNNSVYGNNVFGAEIISTDTKSTGHKGRFNNYYSPIPSDAYVLEEINSNDTLYIDKHILTFHTPDLDFNNSYSETALSLIGKCSNIRMLGQTSIINNSNPIDAPGVINPEFKSSIDYNYNVSNTNNYLWGDRMGSDILNFMYTQFVGYLWHNNKLGANEQEEVGKFKTKHMATSLFAINRVNCNNKIIDIDQPTLFKGENILPLNKNIINLERYYQGNVDMILTVKKEYPLYKALTSSNHPQVMSPNTRYFTETEYMSKEPVLVKYKSSPHIVIPISYKRVEESYTIPILEVSDSSRINTVNKVEISNMLDSLVKKSVYTDKDIQFEIENITDGQTITDEDVIEKVIELNNYHPYILLLASDDSSLKVNKVYALEITDKANKIVLARENTLITDKVKTLSLGYSNSPRVKIYKYSSSLDGYYYSETVNNTSLIKINYECLLDGFNNIYPENFNYSTKDASNYFIIADLIDKNFNIDNIYNNKDNELWIPAGVSTLEDNYEFSIGDTYFGRWDCMKTYPYSNEDLNQCTSVFSVMIESRINLQSRYDKNKNNSNLLYINDTNFNLTNPVYSQTDNYFNYRTLKEDIKKNIHFPQTIIWSKVKYPNTDIDIWTDINLLSSYNLDGDKGVLQSLNKYNNELFALQNNGISQILFNSRVQIPTSDNNPIEITNSLKMAGVRYISEMLGADNKFAIVTSPLGIYVLNSIDGIIYLFNNKIQNLSRNKGFDSWLSKYKNTGSWKTFKNNTKAFVGYYDVLNSNVYFTNGETCLCFNEVLNEFTSFFSYENSYMIENKNFNFLLFNNSNFYISDLGEYNNFFGKYKPFSIEYRVNPNGISDNIFSNIEFISDSFNADNTYISNDTFDTLSVKNEYQQNKINLEFNTGQASNLKKKFRFWRAIIPRDKSNGRDRFRNPWIHLKLSKERNLNKNYSTTLHNMIVYYY